MTNGTCINGLEYLQKVTSALLAMYDPGTREHDWLSERVGKREAWRRQYTKFIVFTRARRREFQKCATKNSMSCDVPGRTHIRNKSSINSKVRSVCHVNLCTNMKWPGLCQRKRASCSIQNWNKSKIG